MTASTIDLFTNVLDRLCAGGDHLSAARAWRIHVTLKHGGHGFPHPSQFGIPMLPPRGAESMKSCRFILELCVHHAREHDPLVHCMESPSRFRTAGPGNWFTDRLNRYLNVSRDTSPRYENIKGVPSASLAAALDLAKKASKGGLTTALAVNLPMSTGSPGLGRTRIYCMRTSSLPPAGSKVSLRLPNLLLRQTLRDEATAGTRRTQPASVARLEPPGAAADRRLDRARHLANRAATGSLNLGKTQLAHAPQGSGYWAAECRSLERQNNKLNLCLFNVDINEITGPKGPETKRISPKFIAWTRIKTFCDVQSDDTAGSMFWMSSMRLSDVKQK
ncbi:hypothetical protein B0H17DRAFT_1139115 [Mycena rosella]|uniref:Uncharacterized protein n=1 Tax=Mycena rosella TaxID=1033263 RepID=A0AAD7GDE9_MYCRO|nr:hypothetical protein B0H17DRAFT_1139115 [Mycena rosella]